MRVHSSQWLFRFRLYLMLYDSQASDAQFYKQITSKMFETTAGLQPAVKMFSTCQNCIPFHQGFGDYDSIAYHGDVITRQEESAPSWVKKLHHPYQIELHTGTQQILTKTDRPRQGSIPKKKKGHPIPWTHLDFRSEGGVFVDCRAPFFLGFQSRGNFSIQKPIHQKSQSAVYKVFKFQRFLLAFVPFFVGFSKCFPGRISVVRLLKLQTMMDFFSSEGLSSEASIFSCLAGTRWDGKDRRTRSSNVYLGPYGKNCPTNEF